MKFSAVLDAQSTDAVAPLSSTAAVASLSSTAAAAPRAGDLPSEGRTRDQVARLILESGPMTAAALAERIDLSPAAIRRHLDALVDEGRLCATEARPSAQRGRGRPARTYALTDAGRASFPHAYDDLATTALRYLRETGGEDAVAAFAEHRAATLEQTLRTSRDAVATGAISAGPATPEQLAGALTAAGYASTVQSAQSGTQICQHHCPVAHVAAEFPELCEAETRAFERVLGTYVQRLATIAHGDGVCTTHIPNQLVTNRTPSDRTPLKQAVPTSTTPISTTPTSTTPPAPPRTEPIHDAGT